MVVASRVSTVEVSEVDAFQRDYRLRNVDLLETLLIACTSIKND